jgi:hypothetical protein
MLVLFVGGRGWRGESSVYAKGKGDVRDLCGVVISQGGKLEYW